MLRRVKVEPSNTTTFSEPGVEYFFQIWRSCVAFSTEIRPHQAAGSSSLSDAPAGRDATLECCHVLPHAGARELDQLGLGLEPKGDGSTIVDLCVTDPPYADAVMYHELTEYFIA
jgi:hypothetical protein